MLFARSQLGPNVPRLTNAGESTDRETLISHTRNVDFDEPGSLDPRSMGSLELRGRLIETNTYLRTLQKTELDYVKAKKSKAFQRLPLGLWSPGSLLNSHH